MSNDTTHPTNDISRGNDTNHLKQRTPYKLFGKRILKTGRLVASSHSTSNAVPTRDCDVLVTFPLDTETPTLMWLLDRLRARTPYIIVHVRHHSNTKGSVFHLTATYDGLLQGAEDLGIRKPLKEEFGGGMKDFTVEDHEFFQNVEDESIFLTSQERQIIVHHLLNNLRAYKGEQLGKVKFLEGQAIVPLLESKRIISQVFPLHHQEDLAVLRKEWIQKFICPQPLDKIRDYFGVKIAMYFAYLGHYTLALLIPAFIGGIIWSLQGESERFDDQLFLAFALFNAFWATLYLEHWKRRSSELAYNWGTLDSKDELLVDPRSLFFGDLVESPVTGRQVPYYPAWKRNLFRYFVTCPVIFLCLTFTFVLMLLIFELQEWINGKVDREELMNFCTVIPKILLAICIGILDDVYKKIAYWLNNKENYRMEETYENHLIVKVALFQFVNSFLSLFYIAFYLQDMNRLRDVPEYRLTFLNEGSEIAPDAYIDHRTSSVTISNVLIWHRKQLAAILITRQVIGNIKEAFLPYLYWKARLYKVGYDMVSEMSPTTPEEKHVGGAVDAKKTDQTSSTDDVKEQKSEPQKPEHTLSFTQAEIESAMKKYEDTFEDYLEMFIQFGYVTLFSSAFPLAALCALLNNVVEIRSDAFKLCMNHQRPFGKRAENIGTWQAALELMGVIAVIVNCALIGVFGQIQRMLPIATTAVVVCIIVFLEHIIMALKFLIAYAIPDVPETIATKKARLEFLRREALKKMESQNQTPPPASPMEIREKIMLRQKSRAEASSQILDGKKLPPSAIPVSIAGQNAPKPPPRQIDLTISGNNPFIKELIRQSESPMNIKGVESRSSAMTTSFHTNCYHSGNSYQTTRQVISSSFPPNRTSSSQHHYCTTSSASPDSRTRQQSDLIPNKQNTPSSSQENAKLNISQKTVRPRSPLMMDKSSSLPIPVPHTDAKHSDDPTSCDLRQRVRLEGNKSPTPV